jgi:hypothetical protein
MLGCMELSRAEWARHLESWRRSGETATRYCEEHGLKLGSLRYWSGRIGREVPVRKPATASESSVRLASVRRTGAPSTGAVASVASSGVRVRLGRAELDVSVGFDEETLARVLRVLSQEVSG